MKKAAENWMMVLIIFGAMIVTSCKPQNLQSSNTLSRDITETEDKGQTTYLRLADYLRNVPGLRVTGNGDDVTINIRNAASFNADMDPLYVVDNVPIGQDYQQAAAIVDPNDISSVRVLRDVVSTSSYGMRGANGVILIKTKSSRNNKK